MGNVLEYTLSLQDKISSKLQKIGVNSNYALDKFAALQQKTRQLDTATKAMGKTLGTLRDKLALLKAEREWIPAGNLQVIRAYNREIKKLTKEINRLETINGGRLSKWMGELKSQMPAFLTNPLTIIGAGIGGAMRVGIQNELNKTSFEVLLNSRKAAEQLVGDIRRYAIKSGYNETVLSKAVQTMLGFGVAKEKVIPVMKAIGDIARGDAQKYQSLTLAFSQMYSTGKLMGQDWLQMINAGFNPLTEIYRKTGIEIDELKEKMAKGAISAQMVEEAFLSASKEGRFSGMMEKMSQTLQGQINLIRGKLISLGISLYDMLKPIVMPVLKLASWGLGLVAKGFGYVAKYAQYVKPVIFGVGAALMYAKARMAAVWLWSKITSIGLRIQAFSWRALGAAVKANPIGFLLGILTTAIVYLTEKTTGWGKAWKYVMEGAGAILKAFVYGVKAHFLTMFNGIVIILDKIKLAYYKFRLATHLGSADANRKAIAEINADITSRQQAVAEAWRKTGQALVHSGKAFKKAFGSIRMKQDEEGIGNPAIPGMTSSGAAMGVNTEGGTGTQTGQNISAGGRSVKRISINIGSLIEKLIIQHKDAGAGIEEMEEQVREALVRVLASASNAS